MKPANYLFQYRCQMNRELYWQRHYCETKEDIDRIKYMMERAYGTVEEIEEELSHEEYENQEA